MNSVAPRFMETSSGTNWLAGVTRIHVGEETLPDAEIYNIADADRSNDVHDSNNDRGNKKPTGNTMIMLPRATLAPGEPHYGQPGRLFANKRLCILVNRCDAIMLPRQIRRWFTDRTDRRGFDELWSSSRWNFPQLCHFARNCDGKVYLWEICGRIWAEEILKMVEIIVG